MRVIPDNIDFSKYQTVREGDCVRPASDWRNAVHDRFAKRGRDSGFLLPWAATHDRIQLRPGEVTILAGINGHGKSLLAGLIQLWLMKQGAKVVGASMEMPPDLTMTRMIRQAAGSGAPTPNYVDGWMSWTDDRLWVYDQQDSVPTDRILGMTNYSRSVLGADFVFIDSLMKCGMDDDDYSGQKRFVDRLCWMAKDTGVHVVLLAHMRKGEREGKRPDKFDVLGGSAITNLVDNVAICHRNKDKEEAIQAGKHVEEHIPDQTLNWAKQRHGDWEGIINLWFHKQSEQYVRTPDCRVMDWGVDVMKYGEVA